MTRMTGTPLSDRKRTPGDLAALDLADPRTCRTYDLADMWRRFRIEEPVAWREPRGGRPGYWSLTRYADVMEVYRDNRRFTSERGNVLATLLTGGDSAAGKMLAVTDGERHQRLRNVMLKTFSPRFLESVGDRVRAMADRLVAECVERGRCDFARDVAEKLPMGTICYLLGVPPGDHGLLLGLTKSALSSEREDTSDASAVLARNEILLYFMDLLDQVRKSPREGVVSALANGTDGAEGLRDEEIVLNCYSLIIGGDETSRLCMIGAVPALVEHPDQWELLRSGEVRTDTAVDEILRWTTPAMHFGRTALEQVRLGARVVAPGEIVVLWNTSANRDETVFDDPGALQLARTPNRHLTFGYGPHFCIGAHLGRTEVGAVLDALRRHAAELSLTAEPQWVHSNFLQGISSLPVEFRPA